ncbi:MAG: hypothetical protein IPQ07_36080 [Myxococcales bacterium]|nr:hypothetical protein [Myxococcales bacterium]
MRAALVLVVALGAPAVVHAEGQPLPPTVFENRVQKLPAGTIALAPISHTVFINQCVGGCQVIPGGNDSRTNHSSIPQSTVTLSAWNQGDPKWQQLVQCVKDTFIPFNIDVVTTDPGSASHFEVMVTGGPSTQLRPGLNAGGVAPFIGCDAQYNNGLSFVFGGSSGDLEFLCGAVVQEAAHVWGLDHEYHPDDPMTYLNLGSLKRFQNAAVQCHDSNQPPNPISQCQCGGATQNSYQYMLNTFGPSNLPPATISIATPTEGQWVRPGFPVRAQLTSQISGVSGGSLSIDGTQTSMVGLAGPLAFNAPTTMTGGDHTVLVSGSDGGGRSATATVHVKVTAICSAAAPCAAGTNCIGGFCVPGADVDGGLGATCTANDTCITNQCGTANGESLCTGMCDADGTCPSGFSCIGGTGAAGVCWPSSDDGGCSTSGDSSGSPLLLLAAFGFVAVVLRRRA